MNLLTEGLASFAGGVNDSSATDEYTGNQAQLLINVRPSLLGGRAEWSDLGERLSVGYNFQLDTYAQCFGAIEFYTAAGVQQIVAAFADAMYYSLDGGRTFTVISGATSLREDFWSFAIYREGSSNVLCCANGGTNSYQYNGTTWGTISNIPSGAKHLAVLGDRLIANDGTTSVEASAVGNIDDGYGGGTGGWSVKATTHDGDTSVTGLFTIGSILLVFKRKSVGYIEGFGYQTLQVETGARGISRSVGCVAFRSIAPAGDQAVMWLSERGFEYYAVGGAIQYASAYQQRFVGKINYDIIADTPGVPSAMWVASLQEYWCSVPVAIGRSAQVSQSRNTWTYAFRLPTGDRPAAAHLRYPCDANDGTMSVGSDGMLALEAGTITESMLFVDGSGMLDVCRLPDVGLWARVAGDGMLQLHAPAYGPAALYTADMGTRPGAPCAGTYECGVMEMCRAREVDLEMVRNGNFASSAEWAGSNVTIASGTATFDDTASSSLFYQAIPYRQGRTYRLRFSVVAMTKGAFTPYIGNGTGTQVTAPGVYSQDIEAGSEEVGAQSILMFQQDSQTDASLSHVSLVDVTGDESPQIGVIRTRPLVYGDEFTRKKAKRITVLARQPLAHTATVYALTDSSYGTGHSLSYTGGNVIEERRARVGGRGRLLQAEVHLTAESAVDGITVAASLLRDEQ